MVRHAADDGVRWLATGLHGELGSQLTEILAATARRPLEPVELGRPVRHADTVLHMAARAYGHGPFALFRSNVAYLHRVLRYAERCSVRRFVFFSTASLYRGSAKNVLTEADAALRRGDFYAWTKWLGEWMVTRSRIPVRVIIRMPALLELRKASNFITRAYLLVRQGTPPSATNLDQPFNWFVSAAEILRFVDGAETTGTVNLAPEATHTLREHLDAMCSHVGQSLAFAEASGPGRPAILCTRHLHDAYRFTARDSLEELRDWMVRRDAG